MNPTQPHHRRLHGLRPPSPLHGVMGALLVLMSTQARADNDEALQAWSAASGQPAPQVVEQADGSTRLTWKNTFTVDLYNSQRTGGDVLSPVVDGSHQRFQWQSDLRYAEDEQSLSWFMLGIDTSDDSSVVRDDWNLSTFQIGHATTDYRVALGDVPVEHSTLGARSDLKGLFFESNAGRLQLSGAAGQQAETWRSLALRRLRHTPLRDVYAVKVGSTMADGLAMYGTAQGYAEDADSVDAIWQLSPQQRASATTVGLDYTSPSWQVQAEAGVSRWQVDGAAAVNDRARRLAVTWQGETVSVQGGHHDVGAAYAALSADVVPGARETYLNSGWRATDHVQLAAGVRRAKNSLLEGAENLNQGNLPHRVDQLDASAMVDMSAVATGLQLQANVHEGQGENFDDTDTRTRTHGVNLSYPVGQFTTSLGLQHNRFENGATPLQDATAKLLSTGLGWSNATVEDAVWRWNVFGQYNLQHQRFDAGGIGLNRSVSLSMDLQRERWGSLRAAAQWGRLRHSTTGSVIGRSLQFDATTTPSKLGAIKAYARVGQNSSTVANASYKERVYGLQWLLGMD